MRAVNVGIGHDDDLVIAQLIYVELVAYAGAERGYDRRELVVAVDLVGAGLFHVQHLAPEREYRLEARVAPLRSRAACRVALDDVKLGERSVALVAVAQLVGHLTRLKPGLAAHALTRLARGLARPRGGHGLVEYRLADGGVFLKELLQLVRHDGIDQRAHLGVAELCLGLALELRLSELDRDYRGHALAAVLAGELIVVFEYADLSAVGVENAGERGAEAGLVHASLGRVDVVCKGNDDLVVAVVILQSDLRLGVGSLALHVDDLAVQGGLVLVYIRNELADAAGVAHLVLLLLSGAPVLGGDVKPAV